MPSSHSSSTASSFSKPATASPYRPLSSGSISRPTSTLSGANLPPPDPPTILPPASPPPSLGSVFSRSEGGGPSGERHATSAAATAAGRAPYEPFLSHAPPPVDSWIEVETTQGEYRLHVRLPGFKRDGITLATKKRRILHVVADSWEEGGGHFERRISFGYDADLLGVRAEFDGEMLKVIVPRRIPTALSTSVWSTAPVGRRQL